MTKRRLLLLLGITVVAIGGLRAGQSIIVQTVSVLDFQGPGSTPGNPSANKGRVYYDKNLSQLVCKNSDGSNCGFGGGGGGTVTACGGAAVNQVAFFTSATALCGSNNFAWNNAGQALGITGTIDVEGTASTFSVIKAGTGGQNFVYVGSLGDGVNGDEIQIKANNTGTSSIILISSGDQDFLSTNGKAEIQATKLQLGINGVTATPIEFQGATSGVGTLGVDATAQLLTSSIPLGITETAAPTATDAVYASSTGHCIAAVNNSADKGCLAATSDLAVAPQDTPSSGQLVFNQYTQATGAFGTLDLGSFNWTNSGIVTLSRNGAASASTLTLTGTPFAGTGTTSFPLFYVNTTGSTQPAGLSTGGTLIGANADAAFAGNLLGLYKGGTLEFTVSATGAVTANSGINSASASAVGVNARSQFKSGADGRINFQANGGGSLSLTRFTFGTEAATNPCFAPLASILDTCDAAAGATTLGNSPLLSANGNKVFVTGNFTTAANTNLQTITGLTFNFPAVAHNWEFTCDLTYSQGTGAAAVAFGIQAATNNPTNIYGTGIQQITVGPPATLVTGTLATLATTTATTIVSGTPGAQATNYTVHLGGMLELAASANAVNIMVSTATSGDAVTVLRGSSCRVF